jgi:hypothetical protein
MVSYDIQWKKSAEKDLFNIDHQQIPRIIKKHIFWLFIMYGIEKRYIKKGNSLFTFTLNI